MRKKTRKSQVAAAIITGVNRHVQQYSFNSPIYGQVVRSDRIFVGVKLLLIFARAGMYLHLKSGINYTPLKI